MIEEIRVDSDELRHITNRFVQQVRIMESAHQKVRVCLESLKDGGWTGLGADSFFAEIEGKLLPSMSRMIATLNALLNERNDEVDIRNQFELYSGQEYGLGVKRWSPTDRGVGEGISADRDPA